MVGSGGATRPSTNPRTESIANRAALAFNVSKMVSTIKMSAPPSTRPVTCAQAAERDKHNGTIATLRTHRLVVRLHELIKSDVTVTCILYVG